MRKTSDLQLYLVRTTGLAPFGQPWIEEFKLLEESSGVFATSITAPASMIDVERQLNEVLDTYKDVFEDTIGKLEGIKATLHLKENVQPKFLRARQVPYSQKDKVSDKLDRLESQSILMKVNASDWATPKVCVVKPKEASGFVETLRAPSTNTLSWTSVRSREWKIPSQIYREARNSQIDLRQAFLQMEVDEKS